MSQPSPSEYQPIADAIESAGFHTSFERHPEGFERLICVSSRDRDGRLCGNSFWISAEKDQWYLVTWLNHCYAVPQDADLGRLCIDCLQLANTPIYSLPESVVQKYGLKREADDVLDR
ncbi:MAG: hypothetical protein ACYSTY_00815 [Planctomycetota bacterium]|jgi:hypothetical protein